MAVNYMEKFKVGDAVWCKDKENFEGRYTITYFHRPCIVERCGGRAMLVRVADSSSEDAKHAFWVDGNLFEHVKISCKVV